MTHNVHKSQLALMNIATLSTLPLTRDYMHLEETRLADHYPKLQHAEGKQKRRAKSSK